MEREYYLATPGGKSEEAARHWQAMMSEAHRKLRAFCEEVGAELQYKPSAFRDRVCAIYFSSDPGNNWKRIRSYGKNAFMPRKSTKAGKELMKQLAAIEIPNADTFDKLLGGHVGWVFIGGAMYRLSFQEIGGSIVLRVPVRTEKGEKWAPPDATPLKMSEYYALKEAAEGGPEDSVDDASATP